jgi:hypothetical protein
MAAGSIFGVMCPKLEEVEQWLLNCARNANKIIAVESAIPTKTLNALRRLPSMRFLIPLKHHPRTVKIDIRRDTERPNTPSD